MAANEGYAMRTVSVLDSTMSYVDAGAGVPLVFLHGNPTSSYLWRTVLSRLEGPGRRLAPDLIGMGASGKPPAEYRFGDHARYLEAWFDAVGLDDVVLVGHDWGGALAFDWAARHPGRTRGVAFLETIVRPMSWEDFPESAWPAFESLRTPGVGRDREAHPAAPRRTPALEHDALQAAAEGRLIPVIGQRFTLADTPAAHHAIESRTATGKTVLRP
jgi:pimeloyl-ACP methyl ester carboxylesterase